VPYGTGATEPTADLIPKKASTPIYVYTFVGWSRPFSNVTEDIVVKTVYIGVLRTYTYTFYDEDRITILKQVKAVYGSPVIPPPNPTKTSTDAEQYIFVGWDKVIAETLIEDIDYYAVYKVQPKTFNVYFYDGNGFVISVQVVNFGDSAITPVTIPTKTRDNIYTYEFSGWDKDYSCITDEMHIYPTFVSKLREYTVVVIDYDGSTTSVLVEYGKSAEEKLPTPDRTGYRFVDWDKDITVITDDTVVRPIYKPNNYQINFYSDDAESGYMAPLIAQFDSQVTLPVSNYTRKGYYFGGWQTTTPSGATIYFHDGDTFTFNHEGLNLHPMWVPIIYSITYELNGGEAINPTSYTIEDNIVLQSAYKKDHKFLGWYYRPDNGKQMRLFSLSFFIMSMSGEGEEGETPDLPTDVPISEIPSGTIGNITLFAEYLFDGYLTLKEDSTLKLVLADGLNLTELTERTFYSEETPIYIKGVPLGYTAAQLKENFVNEGMVIIDSKGKVVADTAKLGTGYSLVIYDEEGNIRDKLTVVIMGDTDGNGVVNSVDANKMERHISKTTLLTGAYMLAADIDGNKVINSVDVNKLKQQI